MKLTDLNADGGIGANSLLLEIGPFRIVVDAGLHPKKVGREAAPAFHLVGASTVDFIILTHCHLDHVGSLPLIARTQPQAPIFCSVPSRQLAPRMLRNSCNVMSRQREELGVMEYPLFTFLEVDQVNRRLTALPFHKARTFRDHGDEITFTLFPAGHVAGAAGILFEYKHRRIFFTADVQFGAQRTLPGAKFPAGPFDTLVTETTRGATERLPEKERAAEVTRLVHLCDRILRQGGSVLIPVFALGRMQELVALLRDARVAGQLPPVPVYSTGLAMALVDELDDISRRTNLVQFRRTLLKELGVVPAPDFVAGRRPKERGIFLLSSGMMVENTPAYNAASALLSDPASAICFVGYCDPDTPGGQLLAADHGSWYLFDKLNYGCTLRAHIEKFDLSSHADRDELLDFALQSTPRSVVLYHGDPPAREWFRQAFAEVAPHIQVTDPVPLQPVVV